MIKKKELEAIIKKYPDIKSISVHCKKFPKWAKPLIDLDEIEKNCCFTYINKVSIFFHLEEK